MVSSQIYLQSERKNKLYVADLCEISAPKCYITYLCEFDDIDSVREKKRKINSREKYQRKKTLNMNKIICENDAN